MISSSKGTVEDLDPVTIGIGNEGNVLHGTICKTLDPLDLIAKGFEPFASLVNVIDDDGGMTESTTGVRVSVRIAEILIILSTPVVGQLQNTRTVEGIGTLLGVVFGNEGGTVMLVKVGEEVEGELASLILESGDEVHAKDLLIELEGGLGILDPDHGVVKLIGLDISVEVGHD